MSIARLVLIVALAQLMATSAVAGKKAARPRPPAKPTLALVAFEGLAPATAKSAVEEELASLIPDTGFVLQKRAKTASTFAAVKSLGLVCDSGDVDCLIRVGALSGANVVLKGLLSVDGDDGFALDLVAVDVNGLKERGRVRVKVPADGATRREALDSALTGVLRPEAWRGLLRVTVSQRGASIVVDGVPRGFTPLSAPIELTPGPHALFVGLEGFRAHKEAVEVVYDDEVGTDVVLVPGVSEEPPTFSTVPSLAPAPDPVVVEDAVPEPRKTPLRMVMYDVEATGVEPRVAVVMGALLVAELRKRERISVLDSGELRALVGDGTSTAGDVRGCSVDQCFAEVAEALGADGVVVAQLTEIEGQILFGLRRIDQHKQEVVGSFIERVPAADTNALLPLVGKSIAATFGDIPVRAGQRVGVDERATKVLNPPPLPALLAGSLYAGAVTAGVVGAGLLGFSAVSAGSYEAKLAAFQANPEPVATEPPGTSDVNGDLHPLEQQARVTFVTGLIGLGAAVVLGAAAAVAGPFTDWEGYGADGTSTPTTPAAQATTTTVTPIGAPQ